MGLYIEKDIIDKSKPTVIIVHGIGEHSGRYLHVKNVLNKAGYNVVRYDQRGHGKSTYALGKLKSFHQMIDDLKLIVEDVKLDSKKVFLLGHSMGGLVVNLYAAKYGDVSGIISSGAATKTPKNAKILKYIGFWYLRWLKVGTKNVVEGLSRDKEVAIKYENDPLVLNKFSISLIGEMFIKGAKYLHKNLNKINVPILYLHGEKDPIVPASNSKFMYQNISVNDKELIIYEGALHEIYNETNKEEVISDTIKWLNKH